MSEEMKSEGDLQMEPGSFKAIVFWASVVDHLETIAHPVWL